VKLIQSLISVCLGLLLFGCGSVEVVNDQPDGTTSTTCTTDADCASSITCQVGTCNVNAGTCNYTVLDGRCLVSDVCYTAGQQEPSVPCNICDPDLNEYAFVKHQCDDSQTCDATTGECVGGEEGICGDGILQDGESCDDNNADAGDGCDAACTVEDGWECTAAGSPCTNIDDCDPNPCQNGGTCVDGIASFTCECTAGFFGDTCENEANGCDPNPCQNGGTCESDAGGTFTCTCPAGYSGTTCETNIDDCNPNPCQNGGTCIDAVDSYSCDCPEGFYGDMCENEANGCDPNPCANGGTCTDVGGGQFSCTCSEGFSGNTCNTNIDDCNPNPCQNGGTCADGIASFTCACAEGFSGDTCETNIDDCEPNPCKNGGACADGVADYTCACADGYSGTDCETNIDDCAPNPCKNGGTCQDGVAAYTCSCLQGYYGTQCENEANGCDPNPCQNGGTCTDAGAGDYSCACAAGYSGDTCQTNIDDCSPNPCLNGGSCADGVDAFTCNCADGYSGATCATNIDDCSPNPCLNGGACVDGVASYSCNCPAGFSGATCGTNIDDCSPNPCQNGGICTDSVNAYICACAGGYTGNNCQDQEGIEDLLLTPPDGTKKTGGVYYQNRGYKFTAMKTFTITNAAIHIDLKAGKSYWLKPYIWSGKGGQLKEGYVAYGTGKFGWVNAPITYTFTKGSTYTISFFISNGNDDPSGVNMTYQESYKPGYSVSPYVSNVSHVYKTGDDYSKVLFPAQTHYGGAHVKLSVWVGTPCGDDCFGDDGCETPQGRCVRFTCRAHDSGPGFCSGLYGNDWKDITYDQWMSGGYCSDVSGALYDQVGKDSGMCSQLDKEGCTSYAACKGSDLAWHFPKGNDIWYTGPPHALENSNCSNWNALNKNLKTRLTACEKN
jgi:hypothetical protein